MQGVPLGVELSLHTGDLEAAQAELGGRRHVDLLRSRRQVVLLLAALRLAC